MKQLFRSVLICAVLSLTATHTVVAGTASELYVSMFNETFEKNERVAHLQTLKCEHVKGTFEDLLKVVQTKMKKVGLKCIDQRFSGDTEIWCRPDADTQNHIEFYVQAERSEYKCRMRAQHYSMNF